MEGLEDGQEENLYVRGIPVGFTASDGTFYLQRCPWCFAENYIAAAHTGQCVWCGCRPVVVKKGSSVDFAHDGEGNLVLLIVEPVPGSARVDVAAEPALVKVGDGEVETRRAGGHEGAVLVVEDLHDPGE